MGGQPSRSKPASGLTIQRVGIDDQTPAPAADSTVKGADKSIVLLLSGDQLTRDNVCDIFQKLIRERGQLERELSEGGGGNVKKTKKKKEKVKQDIESCIKYLGEDLVFVLKDVERRDELLSLDREAFEEIVKSDLLVVPDESYVLLTVGAWAERRANEDEMRDRKQHGTTTDSEKQGNEHEAVNLRGSDGLFTSLGQGAAKLLQPKGNEDQAARSEKDADVKKTEDAGEADKSDSQDKAEEKKEDDAAKEGLSELEINLRGTAGLYATLASAYSNMISDEEMARKLQEAEEEEDKIRRKMMEEEDERLARALQEGELADGGTLPETKKVEEKEDEEDLEPIPEYKLTPEYIDRIKKHMEPFFPYIRYTYLPLNILNTLANEKLVPTQYLTEAYKYHMLVSNDLLNLLDKSNPRLKRRKYISNVEWDRNWHGQHIQVSADGKLAIKLNSSWYSLACATQGFQSGKHFWAVKVEGDEAYIGVTQKGNTSLDNYLGGNYQSWAYRTSYKYSSNHGNGYYGDPFGRGDVIGVLLDMDAGSLTFYKNGKNLGVCFTNLPRSEKLYPAVGWRAGQMRLVDVDTSMYSSDLLSSILS